MSNMGEKKFHSTASPKKKKRKYSVDNTAASAESASFMANDSVNRGIGVIDRVLDVSKYGKKSPSLYSLCRDWINASSTLSIASNEHNNQKLAAVNCQDEMKIDEDESSTAEKSSPNASGENTYFIYTLPDPVRTSEQSSAITAENSVQKLNENIKDKIRSQEQNDLELIRSLNLDDEFMKTHALLKLHVNRWKLARKEWNNHYKRTNFEYKNSADILKSIYEEI